LIEALEANPEVLGFGLTATLLALLAALSWIDIRERRLPDALTLSLLALGLLASALKGIPELADHVAGAALGFLLFLGVAVLFRRITKREGLGGGDIKLAAAAGAWLGWQAIPSFLLFSGLIGILFALIWRRLRPDEPELPFGPALSASLFAIWLIGPIRLAF